MQLAYVWFILYYYWCSVNRWRLQWDIWMAKCYFCCYFLFINARGWMNNFYQKFQPPYIFWVIKCLYTCMFLLWPQFFGITYTGDYVDEYWKHGGPIQSSCNCDWIWDNSASTHNYKYLQIPIWIIWSIATSEWKQTLAFAWNLPWFHCCL